MEINSKLDGKDVNRAKESDNGPYIKINDKRELIKYIELTRTMFEVDRYATFEFMWGGVETFLDYSNVNINSFPVYVRLNDGNVYIVDIVKAKPDSNIILNKRKKLY